MSQANSAANGTSERHSASNSLTIRLRINDEPGMLGKVTTFIGQSGADIGAIDIVGYEEGCTVRDITVNVDSVEAGTRLVEALRSVEGITVVNFSDRTFRVHLGGKIEMNGRIPVNTRDDLSMAYTPGVARVCRAIEADPDKAWSLTAIGNTIAIITNGSRVLALGNIGPKAAMPVMEGKALLFKRFGGVNAWPICLDAQDPEEIIRAAKAIAPSFGGINLEDIASPGCWEVERRLREELDIPIFHDDQHGTAIVVLAATLNAVRLVRKQLRHLRVVVSGVGAAGMACCRLLIAAGVKNLIGFNQGGPIYLGRPGMNSEEQWLAENSNPRNYQGTLKASLKGQDMFLGLSVANVIEGSDIVGMRRDPIIFALANPQPEITPEDAAAHGARIIATGGSEYPNQVNNALVFPGLFRGLLDTRTRFITDEMKIAAAKALAAVIPPKHLRDDNIIASVFNDDAHKAVAEAVRQEAYRSGQARRTRRSR